MFKLSMSTQTQELVETAIDTLALNNITVWNDDFNSFAHVIDTFVDVLGHTAEQAEQCAWIIHTKGKCKVKNGVFSELEPLCTAILERGINAEIY